MKKLFKYIIVITLLAVSTHGVSNAQDVAKNDKKKVRSATVSNLIESRHFTFEPGSVSPAGRPTRQLTSYYDLTLKGDTLICYLPYFGRAYSAPVNPAEGGIHFTSKDFSYKSTKDRKGGWDIVIKPKDVSHAQQLSFAISQAGQASLMVISNNRQPITFMGVIKETRK